MKQKIYWDNKELKSYWVSLTKEQRVKVRQVLGMNEKGDQDPYLEEKADVAKVKELLGEKVEAKAMPTVKKTKKTK